MTRAEEALREKASACPRLPDLSDCTRENLKELAAERGLDFATALLYDRVRRSAQHGAFITEIEALVEQEVEPDLEARVVIVPGAFHQKFPNSGADGRVVRQQAEALGFEVETVPLPDFGSLEDNALALCDWLRDCTAQRVVLATTSKGGSDVKCALARPEAESAFERVVFWLNLSGLLDGSPLVADLFSSTWRSRIIRWLFRRQGFDLELMAELDHGPRHQLAAPLRLPPHLQVLHVVGFPLRDHATTRVARHNYSRLEDHGPNDAAGILLADACRWPGLLYPIWGTDHYLRPRGGDVGLVARALLRYVSRELASR